MVNPNKVIYIYNSFIVILRLSYAHNQYFGISQPPIQWLTGNNSQQNVF